MSCDRIACGIRLGPDRHHIAFGRSHVLLRTHDVRQIRRTVLGRWRHQGWRATGFIVCKAPSEYQPCFRTGISNGSLPGDHIEASNGDRVLSRNKRERNSFFFWSMLVPLPNQQPLISSPRTPNESARRGKSIASSLCHFAKLDAALG